MATQFVKWWKTKFHSRTHHSACVSYNTMSVLGSETSDGRPSDTEDLLRDDVSSCHNGAHVNAALASTSSDNSSICSSEHQNHQQFISNQVKFEDFECDVQVEGSESGEERKEFSFTFYDLDGHGKITKDDIAGLVRSIYGAVNDSITVPQGGKKTIKVRLTVTPEQQKEAEELIEQRDAANNNHLPSGETAVIGEMGCGSSTNEPTSPEPETTTTPSRPKLRNNVNVTIHENFKRHGSARHRERFSQSHTDKPRYNSVRIPSSSHAHHHHNLSSDCRGCRNLLPEVFRDSGASPMRHRKKWRERHCSSFQRPDLCDLIQANMEKNNVSPCYRNDNAHIQNHNNRQSHPPSPPLCSHNHLIDPNCPILPLLNNDSCKEQLLEDSSNNYSYRVKFADFSPPVVKIVNSQQSKGQNYCRRHGHHRSRSHDLSDNQFKYHLMGDNRDSSKACNNQKDQCNHEESMEILTGCVLNSSQQQPSPWNKNTNSNNKNILNKLTTPGTTPHQLKHRNREEDHARAMAQVINWLERENIGEKSPKQCFNLQQHHHRQVPSSPSISKKHEHHHVHEHIHHHYHHHFSKETPIIV